MSEDRAFAFVALSRTGARDTFVRLSAGLFRLGILTFSFFFDDDVVSDEFNLFLLVLLDARNARNGFDCLRFFFQFQDLQLFL